MQEVYEQQLYIEIEPRRTGLTRRERNFGSFENVVSGFAHLEHVESAPLRGLRRAVARRISNVDSWGRDRGRGRRNVDCKVVRRRRR